MTNAPSRNFFVNPARLGRSSLGAHMQARSWQWRCLNVRSAATSLDCLVVPSYLMVGKLPKLELCLYIYLSAHFVIHGGTVPILSNCLLVFPIQLASHQNTQNTDLCGTYHSTAWYLNHFRITTWGKPTGTVVLPGYELGNACVRVGECPAIFNTLWRISMCL